MGEDPDRIRQDIEATRNEMGETVDALTYKADVKSRAKESLMGTEGLVKSKVAASATPDGEQVKDGAAARRLAQENPLGLAIGSVAVGFIAGLLIPASRVEDRKLGPVADDVKAKAKETGQEALERGQQVAQEAAESARDTVQEKGREHGEELASSARKHQQAASTQLTQVRRGDLPRRLSGARPPRLAAPASGTGSEVLGGRSTSGSGSAAPRPAPGSSGLSAGVEPADRQPPGRSPRISRGSSTTAASNSRPLIASSPSRLTPLESDSSASVATGPSRGAPRRAAPPGRSRRRCRRRPPSARELARHSPARAVRTRHRRPRRRRTPAGTAVPAPARRRCAGSRPARGRRPAAPRSSIRPTPASPQHGVPRAQARLGGALRDVAEHGQRLPAGAADDHAQLHRREVLRLVDHHVAEPSAAPGRSARAPRRAARTRCASSRPWPAA
jgi:hypothetical protein